LLTDTCRETLDGKISAEGFSGTLDPFYRDPEAEETVGAAEMKWAMCAGTNRGSLALDGGPSSLGAFTSHVISMDCGLFEPNVPLNTAINLACDRVQLLRTRESSDGSIIAQQVPLRLMNNIPPDFCLYETDDTAEQFDVCICYRRDIDSEWASFVHENVKRFSKVFWQPTPGPARHTQIARAVCNSSIIVLIISERTFADINTFQVGCPPSAKEMELANLLQQIDMILEIYEHRKESVRVLPVYFGNEEQDSYNYEGILKLVDRSKCWPKVSQEKVWAPFVRQRALRQLRLVDKRLACLLHDRDLDESIGFPPMIPSLIKGRQVGQTMRAFHEGFEPMPPLLGRKTDVGFLVAKVVEDALSILRYVENKQTAEHRGQQLNLRGESHENSPHSVAFADSSLDKQRSESGTAGLLSNYGEGLLDSLWKRAVQQAPNLNGQSKGNGAGCADSSSGAKRQRDSGPEETGAGQQDALGKSGLMAQNNDSESLSTGLKRHRPHAASASSSVYSCYNGEGGSANKSCDEAGVTKGEAETSARAQHTGEGSVSSAQGKDPAHVAAGKGGAKMNLDANDGASKFDLSSAGASNDGYGAGGASMGADMSTVAASVTKSVFPYSVFISHTWDKDDMGRDNHARAKKLNESLQHLGLTTWFDDEQMRGNILLKMAKGIEGSAVILICVTRRYMEKVAEDADNNCKFEFEYALNKRTTLNMLPIVMEESVADTSEWRGSLSMTLGRHLYRKLTTDIDADFDDAVTVIAAEIREMIQPQKVLANEMQFAAYTINSRSQSPTPSAASGMDTVPASPQSPEQEVLAMHIDKPEEVSQFREDMKNFM